MEMREYRRRRDALAEEERWLTIPGRQEFLLAEIGRGRKVLDVGCLGGRMSALVQAQHNEVWGLELNPEAAREARRRGIRVVEGDAEQGLPFPAGEFDFVHAGEILEYLYDTSFFFAECARVLKPGGALLLTTVNLNSLANRVHVLTGGYLRDLGAYPEDHHGDQVRVFNLAKLRELAERSGFAIERVRGVPTLRAPGAWARPAWKAWSRWWPQGARLLLARARKLPSA
jgi:2-polyprenyl-6-hydroxyphenyl methylase/3-demethylubiquinone-9 3-methyltransferase